jgi:hypothetical protein
MKWTLIFLSEHLLGPMRRDQKKEESCSRQEEKGKIKGRPEAEEGR